MLYFYEIFIDTIIPILSGKQPAIYLKCSLYTIVS